MVWLSLLAMLLVLPAGATAQSLVDAARAAEAQRDEVGEAERVFTNESLRAEAPPAAPLRRPSAAEAAAARAATAEEPAEPTEPGEAVEGDEVEDAEAAEADGPRDEDYWRGRLAAARAELARNETLLAALQSRINALNADFVNTDDPVQRQAVFDQRQTALDEQARMQETIDANREAIADVQEEGRRAGVPAAWLR